MTTQISAHITKLNSFPNDEREMLVEHADLISQDETEHKIILYSSSLENILDELEDEDEFRDEDFTGFRIRLNDMIIAGADQYIFD